MSTVVRIYREGALSWWAELWRERDGRDPPMPDWEINLTNTPKPIAGMTRVDLAFCHSRRSAIRKGKKLQRQYSDTGTTEPDLREEIVS